MKILHIRLAGIISLSLLASAILLNSCTKEPLTDPEFNLDAVLKGGKGIGFLQFRQDADAAKIIDLNIKVAHLLPNHEYQLQRAVDNADKNCTSTAWLTLGEGLVPKNIVTDITGSGEAALWRDVTAIATGTAFDIHFQVVDAATQGVVLTSDCYQYTVR